MTNEEAIRHLQTYSSTNGSGQTTQAEHEEAKRTAIKALSQQTDILDTLQEMREKINNYRIDCDFSISDNDEKCRRCNSIMFGAVLKIIDVQINSCAQ